MRSEFGFRHDEMAGLGLDLGGEARHGPGGGGALELTGEAMTLSDAINGAGMGRLVSQVLMELTGTPGGMLMQVYPFSL